MISPPNKTFLDFTTSFFIFYNMSEIEKAIEANATEKVEDNKSDIDAQELDEVDKNGDSKVVEETVLEDETE